VHSRRASVAMSKPERTSRMADVAFDPVSRSIHPLVLPADRPDRLKMNLCVSASLWLVTALRA
jgi:hypothetical protein